MNPPGKDPEAQGAQSRRTGLVSYLRFIHNATSCSAYPVSIPRRWHSRSNRQARQDPYGDDNGTLYWPKRFLVLTGVIEGPKYAPKHGDTSATYWKLYGFEAEIYDKNFVESLLGNTHSMVFLVRGGIPHRFRVHIGVSYNFHAEHFILCHCRSIHHRNIQDPLLHQ